MYILFLCLCLLIWDIQEERDHENWFLLVFQNVVQKYYHRNAVQLQGKMGSLYDWGRLGSNEIYPVYNMLFLSTVLAHLTAVYKTVNQRF